MKVILFILSASTLLLAFHIFLAKEKSEIRADIDVFSLSQSEELQYWSDTIGVLGGVVAYSDFGSIYDDASYEEQHNRAHIFGEALYKTEGIDGITVCDANFGYGCFHSFFGWAMIDVGTSIMNDLDTACVEAYGEKGLGCPHGIGHGVLAEMSSEKLTEALELCDGLTWKGPIGGCSSGVFMEFNYNTMGDGDLRSPTEDWHYPCNTVPEAYRQACYFEQTTWWAGVMDEEYDRIGELCFEVAVDTEREVCFRGVGHTVATTNSYDFEMARSVCSVMPDSESEILCVEGATWIISWQPEFKDTWKDMCEGFTEPYYNRCIESHNFI